MKGNFTLSRVTLFKNIIPKLIPYPKSFFNHLLPVLTFDPIFILPLKTWRPRDHFCLSLFLLASSNEFCVGGWVTERGANELTDQSLKD